MLLCEMSYRNDNCRVSRRTSDSLLGPKFHPSSHHFSYLSRLLPCSGTVCLLLVSRCIPQCFVEIITMSFFVFQKANKFSHRPFMMVCTRASIPSDGGWVVLENSCSKVRQGNQPLSHRGQYQCKTGNELYYSVQ